MGICPNGGDGVSKYGNSNSVISVDIEFFIATLNASLPFIMSSAIQLLLAPQITALRAFHRALSGQPPTLNYAMSRFFHYLNEINSIIAENDIRANFLVSVPLFCKLSPPSNIESPSYDEVYGFLLGFDANADILMYKLARIAYTNLWYQHCICKSELPPKPLPPPPADIPECPFGTQARKKEYGIMYGYQTIREGYTLGQAFQYRYGNRTSLPPYVFANEERTILYIGGGNFPLTTKGIIDYYHGEPFSMILVPMDGSPPINIGRDGFPDIICDFIGDPTPPRVTLNYPTGDGLPCPECQSVITESFTIQLPNEKLELENQQVSLLRLEPEETTPENQFLIDLYKEHPEFFEGCTPCPDTEDVSVTINRYYSDFSSTPENLTVTLVVDKEG